MYLITPLLNGLSGASKLNILFIIAGFVGNDTLPIPTLITASGLILRSAYFICANLTSDGTLDSKCADIIGLLIKKPPRDLYIIRFLIIICKLFYNIQIHYIKIKHICP